MKPIKTLFINPTDLHKSWKNKNNLSFEINKILFDVFISEAMFQYLQNSHNAHVADVLFRLVIAAGALWIIDTKLSLQTQRPELLQETNL